MNLKKKVKGFFTLSRKADGGFTLVELIVVIAVLAILGGVAVPAYSGYVKKAERAADEQLLGVINKAYAAACLENGTDMVLLSGASMPLSANKSVDRDNVEPYADAFKLYYTGNEDAAFKVFESIVFDLDKHMFVNVEDAGTIAITVNGKTYIASGEDVAKVLESTWAKELDAKYVLDMVAGVAELVQSGYNANFDAMIVKEEYKAAAAAALGLNPATAAAYDEYRNKLVEEETARLKEQGLGNKEATLQAEAKLDANVAVLVAAQNAQSAGSNIIEILTTDNGANAKELIKGNVDSSDPTGGLSQAALAYGLYNAYTYQRTDLNDDEKKTESTPVKALNNFDDPEFQKYLKSEQGKKDLDGLLASLNVASSQNKETAGSIVTDGINNSDLVGAVEQLWGTK